MPYRHSEPLSKQVTIVMGLSVVGFMAFGLTLSFYRNVLFEQTLENIRVQNDVIKQNIEEGYTALEYYRSAQFKDKYAKEHLGRINPGERVLVIGHLPQIATAQELENLSLNERQEATYTELLRQMPVIEHWRMYLFYRDQLEELRRSFLQT